MISHAELSWYELITGEECSMRGEEGLPMCKVEDLIATVGSMADKLEVPM